MCKKKSVEYVRKGQLNSNIGKLRSDVITYDEKDGHQSNTYCQKLYFIYKKLYNMYKSQVIFHRYILILKYIFIMIFFSSSISSNNVNEIFNYHFLSLKNI